MEVHHERPHNPRWRADTGVVSPGGCKMTQKDLFNLFKQTTGKTVITPPVLAKPSHGYQEARVTRIYKYGYGEK